MCTATTDHSIAHYLARSVWMGWMEHRSRSMAPFDSPRLALADRTAWHRIERAGLDPIQWLVVPELAHVLRLTSNVGFSILAAGQSSCWCAQQRSHTQPPYRPVYNAITSFQHLSHRSPLTLLPIHRLSRTYVLPSRAAAPAPRARVATAARPAPSHDQKVLRIRPNGRGRASRASVCSAAPREAATRWA